MALNQFKDLIGRLKLQHLPDGDVEVFDITASPVNPFLAISKNITQMTAEMEDEVLLVSKITPTLGLQVKAQKSFYNIGILKNISHRISNELRSNALVPSI